MEHFDRIYSFSPTIYYNFVHVTVLAQLNLNYAAESLVLPLPQDLVERKMVTKNLPLPEKHWDHWDRYCAIEEHNALDSWIEACAILACFRKFHVFFGLDSERDWDRDDVLPVC